MADPGMHILRTGPETVPGGGIPFRFEVTWRSLTRPLGMAEPAATALTKAPRRSPPAPPRNADAKEWEMVLPRMKRPAPSPARRALPEAREETPISTPNFASEPERGSRRWLFPAGAALLIPLALLGLRWTERSAAPSESAFTMEMGSGGWFTE